MYWLVICLPLMIIGVAIATVPLLLATHHQHKHDRTEEYRPLAGRVALPNRIADNSSSWTVCSDCSAVVADVVTHKSSVHVTATAAA